MSAGPSLARRCGAARSSRAANGLGTPWRVSSSTGSDSDLARLVERLCAAGGLEEHDGDVVLASRGVRRVDEHPSGFVEVVGVLLEDVTDRVVADHRRQAVGAEHEHVSRLRRHGHHVHRHLGVRPQGARDDGPVRMAARLVGREPARADELGDERVVIGELLERAVAEEVRAGVAHVADPDVVVLDERHRHRRAHPRDRLVAGGALVHAAVRILDEPHDELPARASLRLRLADRRRRQP